jgi:hypothetical protein
MIWGFVSGFSLDASYAWWYVVCTRFLSRREYMRVVLLCPTSWETISFQIGLTCPANRSEGVATLDMGNTGGTCKVLRRIHWVQESPRLGPKISVMICQDASSCPCLWTNRSNEAHSSGEMFRNYNRLQRGCVCFESPDRSKHGSVLW